MRERGEGQRRDQPAHRQPKPLETSLITFHSPDPNGPRGITERVIQHMVKRRAATFHKICGQDVCSVRLGTELPPENGHCTPQGRCVGCAMSPSNYVSARHLAPTTAEDSLE